MTRVVGPYHHDSNLGLNAIPSALVQAPNHVLGAIPTKSKVDGFAVAVILLPNGLSIAFPSLSDGITNESKVDVPFLEEIVLCLVPLTLPGFISAGLGDHG